MHHKPHIGLVDPHAERDGRRHHNAVFLQKPVLVPRALPRIHPGMVGHGLRAAFRQPSRHFLGPVARCAIDNPALLAMTFQKRLDLAPRLVFRLEPQIEIWPVKTMHENVRRPVEQPARNVAPRVPVSRCGKRNHLHIAQSLHRGADLAIFRPEIMPPFRDAMRLVNRHALHACTR